VAKQVLVVDDHPGVALALRVSFRLDGRFEVADTAHTAAEGLAKLDGDADVLVLDLHLPDMAGRELVHAFRTRRPDLPVVLHSASGDTPEVEAVRDLVDAVALKSHVDGLIAELARLTGA
jgi:DNA-binding NarL/FixJ family response regulator